MTEPTSRMAADTLAGAITVRCVLEFLDDRRTGSPMLKRELERLACVLWSSAVSAGHPQTRRHRDLVEALQHARVSALLVDRVALAGTRPDLGSP